MKNYHGITLIFIIENNIHLSEDESYYKKLVEHFDHIIPIIKGEKKSPELALFNNYQPIFYEDFEDKVNVVNRAAKKINTPWIFILESDERLVGIDALANLSDRYTNCCFASQIETASSTGYQLNYQIRLIPNPNNEHPLFDGCRITDLSRSYLKNKWQLADYFIPIQKKGALFKAEDVKAEANTEDRYFMQDFWKGIWHLENKKFNIAASCFKKILRKKKLLFEFYELSALNNLVISQYEQHHFEESADIAKKSLNTNSRQYTPYIILHKINELAGHYEESYDYLKTYLEVSSTQATAATMDLTLPIEECHFLMAEISHKIGNYQQALTHYEHFHNLHMGQVSTSVMERLFLYSVEINDYEKSVKYFYKMFGPFLSKSKQFSDDGLENILEALSLFMDNGWYEFVCNIYEQLVIQYPDNNRLLNKWITSLIKNNDFEKAQAIINKRAG